MSLRRALFLIGPDESPELALEALRTLSPAPEALVVRLQLAPRLASRILPESWVAPADPQAELDAHPVLEALVEATRTQGLSVELSTGEALDADGLAAFCAERGLGLVVPAGWSVRHERLLNEVRRKAGVALLWPGSVREEVPPSRVGLVAASPRASLRLTAWLHGRPLQTGSRRFTLLTTHAPSPEAVARFLELSALDVPLDVSPLGGWSQLATWLSGEGDARIGLLVVPRPPPLLLLGVERSAPVLVLPPLRSRVEIRGPALVATDALEDGGAFRVSLEGDVTFGAPGEIPDGPVTLFAAGRRLGTASLRDGVATGITPAASAVGISRGELADAPEALALVEAQFEILRPTARPVLLFDVTLADEVLETLHELEGPGQPLPMAVRLRPTMGVRGLRDRLRSLGLSGRVLDARAVLDEGPAFDVASDALDALRLARVATRLQRAGFTVGAILYQGAHPPQLPGVHAIGATEQTSLDGLPTAAPGPSISPQIPGNAIELELDNRQARHWLLEAIAGARREVGFQVYMCLADHEGNEVGDALIAAGARGVKVRLLVDSLHGRHGSFGAHNPLLVRLGAQPGIELRIARPIKELPSLTDLKQRDHRKLVVVDGALALLGGRNLSHEYYAGWSDVALSPDSEWREVPWVDAGARLRGPAVAALNAAFRDAWVEAGGETFEVRTPAPEGSVRARVVIHRGLRDAHTLETYRELIESARSHVMISNGFPFVLELQHVLLQALARGVRVRVLLGHLTPTFGEGTPFKGPWSTARMAATEFVHSRCDALVQAGAEVYLMARAREPGWDPAVDTVRPHVHSKVLTVDGQRCAVGSANLDVTASYWESELMLVTEDTFLVSGYEAKLSALMDGSPRVDPNDPVWQQRARARHWMRHWPGVLSL